MHPSRKPPARFSPVRLVQSAIDKETGSFVTLMVSLLEIHLLWVWF